MTTLDEQGSDYANRMAAAAASMRAQSPHSKSVLAVTPGADMRYLCGYGPHTTERLSALFLAEDGSGALLVPKLAVSALAKRPESDLGLEILAWDETDDPVEAFRRWTGSPDRIFVNDHMWGSRVLEVQRRFPGSAVGAAGPIISDLRIRKSEYEVDQLRGAARAIDRVHANASGWLRPGRTEREVAADAYAAILEMGHLQVNILALASGPNSASPFHDPSDRPLAEGDSVILSVGGMMPSGYRSNSALTYHLGEPAREYSEAFEHLLASLRVGLEAAVVGSTCAEVDAACRERLREAGLAEFFIHGTGHGIGLETHEPPYLLAGYDRPLEPGFAFTIAPGFYIPEEYGARVGVVVVVSDAGPIVCNPRTPELVIVQV